MTRSILESAMTLPDELCPECRGEAALLRALPDRLVKRCEACGHTWNEPRARPLIRPAGWIRIDDTPTESEE